MSMDVIMIPDYTGILMYVILSSKQLMMKKNLPKNIEIKMNYYYYF